MSSGTKGVRDGRIEGRTSCMKRANSARICRQTDTQTYTNTYRHIQTRTEETDRQTNRQIHRHRQTQTDTHRYPHIQTHSDKHTDTETEGVTDVFRLRVSHNFPINSTKEAAKRPGLARSQPPPPGEYGTRTPDQQRPPPALVSPAGRGADCKETRRTPARAT